MATDNLKVSTDQPSDGSVTNEVEEVKEVERSESPEQNNQLYRDPLDIGDVEDVEDYRPGGLHPINMFDMLLDGRFEVCHKLGSGGIATVWLCYEKAVKKWKAIKINAADRSHEDSPELKVGKVLQKIGEPSQLLREYHVAMPLETFWIDGPNGRHLCTILPVLGPRLSEWREMSLGPDAARINNICYRLTKGLDFLHKHNICHGDFRPENILMQLKGNGLDDLEPEQLFELLHYPDRDEVLTLDGERSPHAPKWLVDPLWWSELRKYISDDIAIVDFGEAFEDSQPPKSLGIPQVYAAPEVIYGGVPAGIKSDLWSLAYTIMGTRTGTPLHPMPSGALMRMERFAGPIPPPYRRAAAEQLRREDLKRSQLFAEKTYDTENPESLDEIPQSGDGNLKKLTWETTSETCVDAIKDELSRELWEQVLVPNESDEDGEDEKWENVHCHLPEDEVLLLTDLLSQLFKYQPRERSSAADILKHPWFKKHSKPLLVQTETSDNGPTITTRESVSVEDSLLGWLADLWGNALNLVSTGLAQLPGSIVLVSVIVLFLGVTYHLWLVSPLCQKVEVVKVLVI